MWMMCLGSFSRIREELNFSFGEKTAGLRNVMMV